MLGSHGRQQMDHHRFQTKLKFQINILTTNLRNDQRDFIIRNIGKSSVNSISSVLTTVMSDICRKICIIRIHYLLHNANEVGIRLTFLQITMFRTESDRLILLCGTFPSMWHWLQNKLLTRIRLYIHLEKIFDNIFEHSTIAVNRDFKSSGDPYQVACAPLV